tara:strand:+ start:788 stop:1177 length:390 start_codon:yes stop_codon:yes gene_type:complete
MKYTIKLAFITHQTAEIEADDFDHAHRLANLLINKTKDDSVSLNFKTTEVESMEIKDITLSEDNFTEEQLAFMKAYLTNVAVANKSVVKAFMLSQDDDEFYKDHSETYSGLADARGMWEDAKRYFKEAK